jgi:predicted ArsR family transcriptional regulator
MTVFEMQSTRQRILEILKEERLATVEQLSAALELTPVTIRHHLEVLKGEGLVEAPQVLRRPGPGRPQHAYSLTEAAADFFPKNYHGLADLMLDEIRKRVPSSELEQIMQSVASHLAAQAPTLEQAQSPQEAMNAAVDFLNDKGYVARWEDTPEGDFLLHTCNCPYKRVAESHKEVCTMDASFVGQLVSVTPQRMSHMAAGDDSCTYLFRFEQARSER